MPKSTRSKHKACPFCGRSPTRIDTRYHQPDYRFGCLVCNIYFDSENRLSECVRRWNRRSTPRQKITPHDTIFTPELDPIQDRFI